MASNRVSIMKELHKLLRKADILYDGQVEFVLDDGEKMNVKQEDLEEEEETYMNIFFFVTPKDGLYRNARIKFHMRVHIDRYPTSAPEITCRNEVYHPNINLKDDYNGDEADICVNLLGSDWQPEVGLDGAVMAVLFLFYNPQLDDALNSLCDGSEGYEEYEENVRRSLRGWEVAGHTFDNLMLESADTEEEGKNDEIVVEESVVKDVESSKQSGAGATMDNDGNSADTSDTTTTTVDPKTDITLTENNVTEDIAVNTLTTEHVTTDNDTSDTATATTLESTVADAEETTVSPVATRTLESTVADTEETTVSPVATTTTLESAVADAEETTASLVATRTTLESTIADAEETTTSPVATTITQESTGAVAEETTASQVTNNTSKKDSGIVLLTSSIATESNLQTVHYQHTSKPSSVFEFWFSKLKKRLSPIYKSFNNR